MQEDNRNGEYARSAQEGDAHTEGDHTEDQAGNRAGSYTGGYARNRAEEDHAGNHAEDRTKDYTGNRAEGYAGNRAEEHVNETIFTPADAGCGGSAPRSAGTSSHYGEYNTPDSRADSASDRSQIYDADFDEDYSRSPQRRRNDYREPWQTGLSDADNRRRGGSRSRRTRNSATRGVMLTLSIVILIIASAYAFIDDGPGTLWSRSYGGIRTPQLPENGSGRDFFPPNDGYFFEFDNIPPSSGAVTIPRAPLDANVTLEISSLPLGENMTRQAVYNKCIPWVVGITASSDVNGDKFWGSGIIMTSDGYIVTNSHIIESTASVEISLNNGLTYDALLVGHDTRTDIAVLKIDATGLPYAEFGDSGKLEVGEDVVAIGNPLGEDLRGTMTNGIISGISRDVDYNGYQMTLLQTTAAINEGNSGGPLINMHGQVIGITNMKMVSYYVTVEAIAFAIPSTNIKAVVDELVRNGYVSGRPGIGITVTPIPSTAKDYYTLPMGVYIRSVNEYSDAHKKGLTTGDIIVAADGEDVTDSGELNRIKDRHGVGEILTLTIYRNGETFDVEIELYDMAELDSHSANERR